MTTTPLPPVARLIEALRLIAHEADQYADGAEDAHYLAKEMLRLHSIAREALAAARAMPTPEGSGPEIDQDSLPAHEDVCGILGPPLMSAPDELRELRQTISAAHDATLEAVRLQEDALGRVQSLIKARAAAPVEDSK